MRLPACPPAYHLSTRRQLLQAETFDLHSFHTLTGTTFMLLVEPHTPDAAELLRTTCVPLRLGGWWRRRGLGKQSCLGGSRRPALRCWQSPVRLPPLCTASRPVFPAPSAACTSCTATMC